MEDKKLMLSLKVSKEYKSTLKELSKKTRITQTLLLIEGLEDLFKKHNLELKDYENLEQN